ncbi:MAG: hypothetical protein ACXWMJ_12355, partial [Syntrophales bacterium]
RKIFVSNQVTLGGYFEGPKRDISCRNVDAEFNGYAVEMLVGRCVGRYRARCRCRDPASLHALGMCALRI